MRKLSFAMIIAFAFLWVSCTETGEKTEVKGYTTEEKQAEKPDAFIRQQLTAFMDDFRKGDSAAIASHYGADALLMPPNSAALQGNAIAAYWGEGFRMGLKDLKLTITELFGDDDYYNEVGTYEVFMENNQSVDKGKYVVVWKKEGEQWKMHRDIWNSDMPVPASK